MIRWCLVSVLVLCLVLFRPVPLGAQVPRPADSVAREHAPPPLDSALAARGRELADQYGCRACHTYKASEPKAMGPSLNGIFQRRDSAYLDQKLAEPQFDNAKSLMPKLPLTASERRAIVEFLKTLN
ncbi:MAG TPA: cytochrome c [Gemmatimonadales bacterium]|nr:cytochrome c [Gemmatimonadales bacterium]